MACDISVEVFAQVEFYFAIFSLLKRTMCHQHIVLDPSIGRQMT